MDVFNLQASIGLNTKNYIDGIKSCMSLGSKLKSSLEQSAQSVTKQQMAIDTLGNKLEGAKAATSDARNAVSRLTDEFNKSVKATGAASDESKELAASLDKAEKELADCEKQERELTEQVDELRKGTKKAGDQADESASKFSKFNDGLKSVASTAGKVVSAVAKISAVAVGAAATGLAALTKQALDASGTYEQLSGGAQKIFDTMDYSVIAKDAANAYKDLNMSVNEYLEAINLAGATFAQTMGDQKGYETARTGMLAIADYASGTGKSIDELNQKYQLITRAASSYQSIADQFSGILPATSADFLQQAQAAGYLETSYKKLTDVPVAKYQEAVTKMLEKGVDALGLSQNTARESSETITGSLSMVRAAWENLTTAFGSTDMPIDTFATNFVDSISVAASNVVPRIGQIVQSIGMVLPGLVSDLFTNLKDTIMENDIGTTVLDGIDSLVKNGANVLQDIISSILDGDTLTNLISRASDTVGTVAESILNVLGSIDIGTVANILNDLVNKIIGGVSELISSDGVDDLLDAVIKAVLSIAENLANNVQPLATAVLKLLTSIMTVVLNNLDDIVDTASAIVQTLLNALVSDGGILDGVITLVSAIADGIVENSDAIMLAIENLITAIWEKITEPETLSKIVEAGVTIVAKMLEGLMSAAGSVLGFVVSMLERAVELIFTRDYKEIGISIIEAIRDGLFASEPVKEFIEKWISDFEEFGGNLYDKVQELKQNIQDKFNELVTNAVNWGKDMIQNFISGITSNIADLSSAATNMASAIASRIHFSEPDEGPLSDFHTYAPDMMKLFASGIEDNAYMIEDAFDKSLDFGAVSMSGNIQNSGASSGAVNGTFTAELLSVLHEILYAIKQGKTISVSAIDSALGQLQSIDERTDFA